MGGMIPAEGMRLLELTCLQEALGPLLGCPCCCSGQLQLHEDVRHSSGLYSALCFACQACHHRLPLHSSCRSGSQGWQVNVCTQQVKTQLGVGEDLLRDVFRVYRVPYRPRSAIDEQVVGEADTLLDCLLDRDDTFRGFVCSLCDQTFECVKMLKQHMGLHTVHNIGCLDGVNLMSPLERSEDNQEDTLHVPIESIVTDSGLDFSGADVEKTLQLSPKTQDFGSASCNQRFDSLDILEQNLNGDSLHSTFEYTDSFDEATSSFSESLSNPTKDDVIQNSAIANISNNKYISSISQPTISSSVSNRRYVCSVLNQHSTICLEQNVNCGNESDISSPKDHQNTEQENKLNLNSIDAIVIGTALEFQPSLVESSPVLTKDVHQTSSAECIDLQLGALDDLKEDGCNNRNHNSYSFLSSETDLIKTINSSVDDSVDHKDSPVKYNQLDIKLETLSSEAMKTVKHESKNISFTCEVCSKTFQRIGALKQHMTQHSNGYACTERSAVFDTGAQLKSHISEVHNRSKYSCSFCGKTFKKAFNLSQHARTHTGEKPFLCSTCGKSFSDASTFNKHQKTVHSNERMLQCPTCGKCFYHAGHLRVHMRQHTGERPYLCQLCGKAYAYPDSIKKHMKIHLDERNFKCAICGRNFRWKESLKQHVKTHQQQSQPADSEAWNEQEVRQPNEKENSGNDISLPLLPTSEEISECNAPPQSKEIPFLDSVRNEYF